jgi:uncharacterized protein YegP (UPF0339 family)
MARPLKFEVFPGVALVGRKQQWFWRCRAGNRRIIGDGSEGYSSARAAERAVRRFILCLIKSEFTVEVYK